MKRTGRASSFVLKLKELASMICIARVFSLEVGHWNMILLMLGSTAQAVASADSMRKGSDSTNVSQSPYAARGRA